MTSGCAGPRDRDSEVIGLSLEQIASMLGGDVSGGQVRAPGPGVVNKGGRPRSPNPRQLISLRLPPEVVKRWRATGPGWQTRMADRLAKAPIPRGKE